MVHPGLALPPSLLATWCPGKPNSRGRNTSDDIVFYYAERRKNYYWNGAKSLYSIPFFKIKKILEWRRIPTFSTSLPHHTSITQQKCAPKQTSIILLLFQEFPQTGWILFWKKGTIGLKKLHSRESQRFLVRHNHPLLLCYVTGRDNTPQSSNKIGNIPQFPGPSKY